MRFSILIAIYNAAHTLPTTLDALRQQTYGDFEAICIDDASTDDSAAIVEEYAARDARFRLLRLRENSGQAVARNAGLEVATGDYVTMLDSDDWYAPDTLERMARALAAHPECEVGVMRLLMCYADSAAEGGWRAELYPEPCPIGQVITGKEAFRLSLDWTLHGLYFVRLALHRQYPYDTSCRLYADDNTTHIHYLHAASVLLTDAPYYYRQHAGSMTGRFSLRTFDRLGAEISLLRQLEREAAAGRIGSPEECRAVFRQYERRRWLNVVDAYWQWYQHRGELSPSEAEQIHRSIRTALHTIRPCRLPWGLRLKPGYMPLRPYALFCLTENLYFWLRTVLRG